MNKICKFCKYWGTKNEHEIRVYNKTCTFSLKDVQLPSSIDKKSIVKRSRTPHDGYDCPVFEDKNV